MDLHDVNVLIHQNLPRPEFYIEDILPKQGVMLVYGNPKVKKSWLVSHMGYAIATGDNWLGLHTTQGRVFMGQFEISPYSYANRMQSMGRHFQLQDNMYFETSPGLCYLEEPENYNRLKEVINRVEPAVIFLDCMAACFGGDENDSREMAHFIEIATDLRALHNSSLVIVHHTNKNILTNNSVDRARGHSRLAGWVDTLLYMAEQPTGVQLQIKSRQATREIPNINVGFTDHNWIIR
jgi:RecA-family ATPase